MPEDIISIIFAFLAGGGILALIINRILQTWDQSRKKVIETHISYIELINPEISDAIPVVTKIKQRNTPILSAYKYTIVATNTGIDDIEKPEIDISFDANAIVYDTQVRSQHLSPDKIREPVSIQKSNYRRIVPQYMNKGQSLTILATTINNKIRDCTVVIRGVGIIHKPRANNLNWLVAILFIFFVSLLLLNYGAKP